MPMPFRVSILAGLMAASLIAAAAPARAAVLIAIDKSTQRMTVSVDGVPRWHWPVSTGRRGYNTPSGSFTTFRMEAKHFSREWDDAPMPHSIFFTKKGHAIHGYLNTRNIGRPASHGCVRLEPANAAKLFALVKRQGLQNTKVVLTGNIALARWAPLRRAPRRAAVTPRGSRQAEFAARQPPANVAPPAQPAGAEASVRPLPPFFLPFLAPFEQPQQH
jgi:L,D-transpeptidase catalytic domain